MYNNSHQHYDKLLRFFALIVQEENVGGNGFDQLRQISFIHSWDSDTLSLTFNTITEQ